MANVDHVKVGSTSYDISPSPTGTLTTGTGGFSSSDVAQGSATGWTNVGQITTSDNHASIFTKITQMAKNVRYLYNVLGTGFSTGSTVKGQIDGKAAANHSHKVAQLPTSSTQVNSNDYIPTSALIYSMNQTLTSLNDASIKKLSNIYITANGYALKGTMIGCDLLDSPGQSSYFTAYQYNGKVYAAYGFNWNTGFDFNIYDSHANIVYI